MIQIRKPHSVRSLSLISLPPLVAALAAALAASAPAPAMAQDSFPTRPVTVIVPFPPGGGADLAMRPLAALVEKVLKQPLLIVNRPGAAGALGMTAAAAAKPDGYTLLATLPSYNILPEVDALFKKAPAFTRDQFIPIARLTADPSILVANPAAQWKSVKELVAAARRLPGEMMYSHSGVYGPSHIPMEMFAKAAGIRLQDVPYVGGAPAMTAVLAGQATMWSSPPALAAPHVKAGKVRVFATWGAERNPMFPEAPTLIESGYNVEFYFWVGLFALRGTPDAVVRQLRDAVRQVATGEDYRNAMSKVLTPVAYLDAPEFQKFLDADARRIGDAVRAMPRFTQ
jgi:tripartite-type tricarboxylate transporter receptor subunit TctC